MNKSLRSMIPQAARPSLRLARIGTVVLRPRRPLFLFSHMRSYSSLLGHILGSNPEINGYSELQISYETEVDLFRSILRVYETNDNQLHGKYIFDKILHGHLTVGNVVLDRPRAVGLFTVREPEDTLRSVIAMARKRKKRDWKADVEKVAAYYSRRMTQLPALAEAFRGPTCVFEAEDLMTRTDELLEELTTFLKLKKPLQSQYDVFSHTGRRAYGDPGENIQSGRLVTDRAPHDEIAIGHAVVAQLETERLGALDHLRRVCDLSL
jgi:hypothetical protein